MHVAKTLCRTFEGFSSSPYLCPADVPTIGYGTTYYPDGRRVTIADAPISQETGAFYLQHELTTILPRVVGACPPLADYPGKLGAVLSWTFNLGLRRLRASTMRLRINDESWDDARVEMQRWVFAGGRRLAGLVRRREAEAKFL